MAINPLTSITGATGIHAPEPSRQGAGARVFEALISDVGVDVSAHDVSVGVADSISAAQAQVSAPQVLEALSSAVAEVGAPTARAAGESVTAAVYTLRGTVTSAAATATVGKMLDVTG